MLRRIIMLGLLVVTAGCFTSMGEGGLFGRLSSRSRVVSEPCCENTVGSGPIITAPGIAGPLEATDDGEIAPPPRIAPPNPMAQPLPYAPDKPPAPAKD